MNNDKYNIRKARYVIYDLNSKSILRTIAGSCKLNNGYLVEFSDEILRLFDVKSYIPILTIKNQFVYHLDYKCEVFDDLDDDLKKKAQSLDLKNFKEQLTVGKLNFHE